MNLRPTFAILALACALAPSPSAQSPNQEKLAAQRAKKLAKPVFKRASWITDFAAARTKAAAEKKFLLTYFTRSYSP